MAAETVFISSTYKDLKEHRRKVWDVLKRFDVIVRGMEEFGARTEAPLETCLAEVQGSDIYVGIIAYRLGSIDPKSDQPFTILEYETAAKQKKEILIYLADDETAAFPHALVDRDTRSQGRLNDFKEKLRHQHTVVTFSTAEDLAQKLTLDFKKKFAPKEEEPGAESSEVEFEKAEQILKEFRLTPKRYNAHTIRLRVSFRSDVFPASRELCERFNLDYGFTVGAQMVIAKPKPENKGMFTIWEMLASRNNVDLFRSLVKSKEVELYAQLRFTEQDVKRVKGVFLGYSYYDDGSDEYNAGDPNEIYVHPEGRAVLIFSNAI